MKRGRLSFVLLIVCGITGFALWLSWKARHSNAIQFLPNHRPAQWIVYPSFFSPKERPRIELDTRFRHEFFLKEQPGNAKLSWRAFTRCTLEVNGAQVSLPKESRERWKELLTVDVSKLLHSGENRLEVTVYNEAGPPALWLSLEGNGFSIFSDNSWDASYAGAVWRRARVARTPASIMKGSPLEGGESLGSSLAACWPRLLLFAFLSAGLLAGGAWWLKRAKASEQTFGVFADPAAACLAGVILMWMLLFIHNADLLPRTVGFDAQSHMDYINYIQERGRLPLADEGITMYNPPLYYLVAASVLGICSLKTTDFAGIVVLRYLALLIGLVHLLLVFGSLRLIFPRQSGRQVVGLLLAGFLPAQLYLSHYVTNEVLLGALVTATLYVCLRALQDEQPSSARFAGVGAVLGLALLTKFTAVLVVPFVMGAIALRRFQTTPRDVRAWLRTAGLTILTCLMVCGWHYARVWAHFGKPLVGNWEPGSGQFGWQDPGFRTSGYFLRFGESLSKPLFSGQASFMDAIYSTLWGDGYCGGVSALILRSPWNYELMTAGYLLALLPTVLIGVGAVIFLRRFVLNPTTEGLLLNGLAWSFVAALFHMALKFPTYALVKAFYGLLILLPVCTFGALGWDFFARRTKLLGLSLSFALGIWGLASISSYWISGQSTQTQLLLGVDLAVDAKPDKAVKPLSAALAADPVNLLAKSLLADSLNQIGQPTAAERLHKELAEEHPESDRGQMELALALEKEGRLVEAVEHTRRAIAAAPEELHHRRLASQLIKLGKSDQAVAGCREGLELAPADSELHMLLGIALLRQADFSREPAPKTEPTNASPESEEAFRHLRLACQLAPNSFQVFDKLAWILATAPEPRWRNGVEAVKLAQRACELTDYRLPESLGTLAASYAEAGRFPEAISAAQRAQSLARSLGRTQIVGLCDEWINSFRAGRPYREPRNSPATEPSRK